MNKLKQAIESAKNEISDRGKGEAHSILKDVINFDMEFTDNRRTRSELSRNLKYAKTREPAGNKIKEFLFNTTSEETGKLDLIVTVGMA
jgi:hypothetical protein